MKVMLKTNKLVEIDWIEIICVLKRKVYFRIKDYKRLYSRILVNNEFKFNGNTFMIKE